MELEGKISVNMEHDGKAKALTSIQVKLSQLSKPETQPFIYKVQKPLRNINPKAYEPEIIAIGPYHHGKDDLKMMEEHKLRYMESLLQHNNQISVERCISAVAEKEQEARNCYAEPIKLTSAEFIEIMVLDGCFIIELMLKLISRRIGFSGDNDPIMNQLLQKLISWGLGSTRDNDPIFKTQWMMASLSRDLILFENQIPFFVLCKLFDRIMAPDRHSISFMNVLSNVFQDLYPLVKRGNRTNRNPQEVKHLLHLLHSIWRPPSNGEYRLLLLPSNWCPPCTDDVSHSSREYRWIHTVTELKNANVKFWKRESDSLFDVKFENGIIQIPPLTIDDTTECLFRNLIAYEQYFPENQCLFVTDYQVLMDCLINSSRDVEILSQRGIVVNLLGDDEVVANLFNRLGDPVSYGGNGFAYAETFHRINTHYEKRWNRAWAVLNRDYFNSPWAYISFFAAFLLLLLTLAQTVFSTLQLN